ncbi:hypothetical protein [Caldivirga sp.]|jgi:hypothetical protein|uniref:hypothetical protein n=1 Tax=Caldivirga sp. TaxID=2080243 RepID=UPI003D152972
MPVLTEGTITTKTIKGKEYVFIYVGNIGYLKKLKGKKVCLLILEDCVSPP